MRNAMKKDVNYATLHPSSASVIDLSSLQKVYSSSSLLDIEHSDHDIHSECDGVEARSQYSAITSSTMFVRIAVSALVQSYFAYYCLSELILFL